MDFMPGARNFGMVTSCQDQPYSGSAAPKKKRVVAGAIHIRAYPVLAGADPLDQQIKAYLPSRREKGIYAVESPDSGKDMLRRFVQERADYPHS
jgi:hypothetical protein